VRHAQREEGGVGCSAWEAPQKHVGLQVVLLLQCDVRVRPPLHRRHHVQRAVQALVSASCESAACLRAPRVRIPRGARVRAKSLVLGALCACPRLHAGEVLVERTHRVPRPLRACSPPALRRGRPHLGAPRRRPGWRLALRRRKESARAARRILPARRRHPADFDTQRTELSALDGAMFAHFRYVEP